MISFAAMSASAFAVRQSGWRRRRHCCRASALYRMLSSAGELYLQPCFGGWIDDLTTTDPYYVLPAVLVVTMFVQARLQPATADSRQQKFLQYGMPLMFGVMSFFFPAGLTIYIFTNTVLSALHSIYILPPPPPLFPILRQISALAATTFNAICADH